MTRKMNWHNSELKTSYANYQSVVNTSTTLPVYLIKQL